MTEVRYSGKAAKRLRGFKSIYLGVFMNILIIGWVNVALQSILVNFFGVSESHALIYIGLAMFFVVIYASISGFLGVAITDVVQFFIAMTGCIVLAVIIVNDEKIGGITGLKEKIHPDKLNLFPKIGSGNSLSSVLQIPLASFIAFLFFQWWASWYPGAEPGGGGYIAQRMMSTKNEKHAVYSTLFFQIMHYCIRPWPWIIVALCTIVLYPGQGEDAYVLAMKDYLPTGWKGLMLTAFIAAYMSTISTQLNWGASYLVKDFYCQFINKNPKNPVTISRIATIIIMLLALLVIPFMDTIEGVWLFLLESGAGLGLVLMLRWFWWRINIWSEISATITPAVVVLILKIIHYIKLTPLKAQYPSGIPDEVMSSFNNDYYYLTHPYSFFIIIGITTVTWLIVTYLTKPEKEETLTLFYKRIRPQGAWKPISSKLNSTTQNKGFIYLFVCWASALLFTFMALTITGKLILGEFENMALLFFLGAISLAVMIVSMRKVNIFDK